MKITAPGLIRSTGIAAVAAGLLFVVIQPIHPPDALASVTTPAWSLIHQLTLVMTVLFLVGITGIYAKQLEQSGWLGLAGYVALSLGLLLTAGFVFVEAFIEPLLASSSPAFVEGVLGMVEGTPTTVDLGALPTLWSAVRRPVSRRVHRLRDRHHPSAGPVARGGRRLRVRVHRIGADLGWPRRTQAHGTCRSASASLGWALPFGRRRERQSPRGRQCRSRGPSKPRRPSSTPQTQRQGDRHERHGTHAVEQTEFGRTRGGSSRSPGASRT